MKRSLVLAMGLATVALPAGAQEPARAGSSTVRGTTPYRYVTARPHLGFSVTTRATSTDTIGARVESVTPGSPAFRAGIRSGDLITHLNDRPLTVRAAPGIRTLSPGTRLLELAARVNPRDTVVLRLRRGSSEQKATLIAEPRRDVMIYYEDPVSQEQAVRELRQRVEEAQRQSEILESGRNRVAMALSTYSFAPFGNLQLAPLNEDLGRYFGTSEGVLVISIARSSALSLRGGDVVLSVDCREPASPAHLLRILGSYGPGEELRLEIFRDRKRRTVTGTIAAAPTREYMVSP